MSRPVTIRTAVTEDAPALDAVLRHLSRELEDPHNVDSGIIASAAFGANPVFHAVVADDGAAIAGFAFVSPVFSSVRGGAGAFISDLWVEPDWRGTGMGRRLLATAAALGTERWHARFLKLSVYDRSPESQAFYARLGFVAASYQNVLYLTEDRFQRLADAP